MTAGESITTRRCVVCRRSEVGRTDNPLAPEFRWISKVLCAPCGAAHPVCLACRRACGIMRDEDVDREICLASDEVKVMLELQGRGSDA